MEKQNFSCSYVMSVTLHHMLRAVDISIRKTVAQLPSSPKGGEVIRTLSLLTSLRTALETQIKNNPELFNRSIIK